MSVVGKLRCRWAPHREHAARNRTRQDGPCRPPTTFHYLTAMTTRTSTDRSQAPATLDIWLHHLEDEADAAFLYRELARAERDASKADLYGRLAQVEDRHVQM